MDKRTRYVKFFDKNIKFIKSLRISGKAGTVTGKEMMQAKGADGGATSCMFAGYPTYRDGF